MSIQLEGKTLTKSEMINHLMENLGMTRQDSRVFVESFFSQLSDSLTQGHLVKLSGFGNFEIKHKSQRPGRNPKTGEMVHVTTRRVVTFKAGQKMRRNIEDKLFSN